MFKYFFGRKSRGCMLYCRVIHITLMLHVLIRGYCTIQTSLCFIIIVRLECLSLKFISSWGCTAIFFVWSSSEIFKKGELDENITCAKFTHVGTDQDQTYETKMYSLDVIISVGYTVKSII